ncbi:MAG: ABC transporter substrate-binding protein [Oscillospiraceae bacterium]|nr:ABC transporter substrate-binding protein [Oscillospiraceae bacterium]MDD4368040.1 ABC transporter substrate-binding protein [Oscillospiraceae bacterium]
MKKSARLLSFAVSLAMTGTLLAACSSGGTATTTAGGTDTTTAASQGEETSAAASESATGGEATAEAEQTSRETTDGETPLVIGYSQFSEKFSPFYADTGYDQDVSSMVNIDLLTTDRAGAIIMNAIEGETTTYNGTEYTYTGPADFSIERTDTQTTYTIKLRDDLKFSDGEPVNIDDVIFSMYVLLDPTYSGSATLSSLNIEGLQAYRTQTPVELYDKYAAVWDAAYAAGEDATSGDGFTEEQHTAVWDGIATEWKADLQAIVDSVITDYLTEDYVSKAMPGFTVEQITNDPGLQVAFASIMWNFASYDESTGLTYTANNTTFDLAGGTYPTIDDLYADAYEAYEGDPEAYWDTEAADDTSVVSVAKENFIVAAGSADPENGGGVANISGIKKVNDYEMTVTTDGFDAAAIYQLDIQVAPLHYYGDSSKYDYDNNQFGFDFGDLSSVQDKTAKPLGAGAYTFDRYENKIVYFEANPNYYKGEPEIKYIQFREMNDSDKISGVITGTIDGSDPSFTLDAAQEIKQDNSNGELVGDKITTYTVDNLGYGYIGANAANVKVGDDPASEESKNLRKAFATVLASYRDVAINSYYGDAATVINYPISNTSWAAPQESDEGYQLAYSVDVDGNPIYTSSMTDEEKQAAALQAAIGYFKAAGYTFDDATGKFTAAPEGARLEYEVLIPGDGEGNHPSFNIVSDTSAALATIGINFVVNDLSNSSVLWDTLDAGTQDFWCAAWGATIDPDMYQIYYSGNVPGVEGSSESNHYHITDSDLDELIMEARTSDDQTFRKTTYKAALDIILDWAVEIPVYQRLNCNIFSTERVNISTLTPDITTFWGWMSEIEKLELN